MSNLGTGKPAVTGGIYVAPSGTTPPTDATTQLNAAFKSLGYISEDGVENENGPSSSSVKEWGGSVVLDIQEERVDTFKYTMLECCNIDVLKEIYGDDNVTGTLATGITIKANSKELAEKCYVIETMIGNTWNRIVIPKGKITSIDTISYKASEPVKYGVTLSAHLDGSGQTHYAYMKTISA